ncbi:MAG: AsmA-like C-terminal region-containing protein, partial [Thermodesulfobacteriota bacterium]
RKSFIEIIIKGFFRNMINFTLFENQPIGIEAKLTSDYLDLDQILSGNYGASVSSEEYSFSISPNLFLNFDCEIKFLKFRRLEARNIKGTLKVKEQLALGKDFTAHAMGGDVKISGMVNARNANDIQVDTEAELNGINIDSMFFVFENFKQTFLVDENLKGQIYANISTEMSFNNKLVLNSDSLISDVMVSIKDGELNDFEPMKKLAKYVSDESDLARLKFSELNNDIHIENKVIYLPQMEVSSNITTISLSGTHTFNQDIDYRVIAPLKRKKISDKDEAFGAIEDDGEGGAKIYLRIKGTTSDYKVTYDIQEVRKKIIADLKNEVKELKTAFRDKGKKKKKVVELNSDEYFDWDNKKKN